MGKREEVKGEKGIGEGTKQNKKKQGPRKPKTFDIAIEEHACIKLRKSESFFFARLFAV